MDRKFTALIWTSIVLAMGGFWTNVLSIFLGNLRITAVGCLMCVLSLLLTTKAVRDV